MTWRHTHWREGEFYPECIAADGDLGCDCNTPTPDPTSPCGYPGCQFSDRGWYHCNHELRPEHDPRACHPHVPTRCATCGHPIQETPR